MSQSWWRQAVVYEVYPRSFADANGDGIGDFRGITQRAEYLGELGIDAAWLTPFYPSELVDGGYDVADYRNVDPRIGTLDDFDAMVAALHAQGIRIFVDIVPNHSSDQHVWFQAALAAGPGSPEREFYIFRDGKGENGELPPNDWPSHWGPTAWTRVPDGQWYLHLFAPEQPDLNWDHPEVRADFLKTLRFWADRGVDGFRIDVAHGLAKDMSEPYQHLEGLQPQFIPDDGTHPLFDRNELQDIYAEWRKVFDSYDPPRIAVGEVGASLSRRHLYTRPTSLHQAFNFELLEAEWSAAQFRDVIKRTLQFTDASGSSSTWVLSNHDVMRHATRYGLPLGTDLNGWLLSHGTSAPLDRELGARRAAAAVMLLLALPGSVYLYQGEELGLHEVGDLDDADIQDPIWERSLHLTRGRDGCRVPLPWTTEGSSFGFGDGGAHLPQPSWFADYAVSTEVADPASMLHLYRRALHTRRELLTEERLEWVETGSVDVLRFRRPNGWECIVNFSDAPFSFGDAPVRLASVDVQDGILPANAAVWIAG